MPRKTSSRVTHAPNRKTRRFMLKTAIIKVQKSLLKFNLTPLKTRINFVPNSSNLSFLLTSTWVSGSIKILIIYGVRKTARTLWINIKPFIPEAWNFHVDTGYVSSFAPNKLSTSSTAFRNSMSKAGIGKMIWLQAQHVLPELGSVGSCTNNRL